MPYPVWRPGERITATGLNQLIASEYKTSDEAINNNTALQNDDELVVNLAAGATYMVDLFLIYASPSTADLKLAFSTPSGATMRWTPQGPDSAASGTSGSLLYQVRTGAETAVLGGTGAGICAVAAGSIVTGDTAGPLQVQWAQNTADAGSTTVRLGSMLTAFRVA